MPDTEARKIIHRLRTAIETMLSEAELPFETAATDRYMLPLAVAQSIASRMAVVEADLLQKVFFALSNMERGDLESAITSFEGVAEEATYMADYCDEALRASKGSDDED